MAIVLRFARDDLVAWRCQTTLTATLAVLSVRRYEACGLISPARMGTVR
jgi:hypothetical protein